MRASPTDAAAPGSDPVLPGGTDAAVLVVEDDALLAMELATALEDAGLRVIGPIYSYQSALEAISREAPRFAVMDVDLGRGDLRPGFEGERLLAVLTSAGCRSVIYSGRVERFETLARYFPDAVLVAKPAPARQVVRTLLAMGGDGAPEKG